MPIDESRSPNRTRDHLANERTFLAWIRTSLGLIGLGFVLARVGLFLDRVMPAAAPAAPVGRSNAEFIATGLGFLLAGIALSGWSYHLYDRNAKAIDAGDYQPARRAALALTAIAIAAGLAIATIVIGRAMVRGGP